MKVLLHITSNGLYVVGDDNTGKIIKYTKKDLLNGQPYKIKYLKTNKKLVVDPFVESKLKSNAISVLCTLSESKKVIGYMIYIPVEDKLVCVSGNKAADYVSKYGIVYGKVRTLPSNKRCLEGKYQAQPARHHKQIYMDLYHESREENFKAGNQFGKIVRPNVNVLEMRYLPCNSFETYHETKGVNIYNFKWWKLEDNKIKLLKRPQAKVVDISKYCEEIKYMGVSSQYEEMVANAGVSLGAFSHWGINSIILGNQLKIVGREAFMDNNLTSVKIPKSVEYLGDKSFMNNMIERLFFCKGGSLELGAYVFANNNLKEIHIPNSIIAIDTGCFAGNIELTKVSFDKKSKIKVLESKIFEDCAIESIELPDSIEEVKMDAFVGCDSLKEIIIGINSKLNNTIFINSMNKLGIQVKINK